MGTRSCVLVTVAACTKLATVTQLYSQNTVQSILKPRLVAELSTAFPNVFQGDAHFFIIQIWNVFLFFFAAAARRCRAYDPAYIESVQQQHITIRPQLKQIFVFVKVKASDALIPSWAVRIFL